MESKLNTFIISNNPAPCTLRIPISFVRSSAAKAAKPNKPIQDMMMANNEKALNVFPALISVVYKLSH